MIVVAVVGILAAIAIPVYANYVAKAQFSEALSLASGVKTAVSDAYASQQTLTGIDNGSGSIPTSDDIRGTYVDRVQVSDGVIVAYFRDTSRLSGQTMTLAPDVSQSHITRWTCSTTVSTAKAPASCR